MSKPLDRDAYNEFCKSLPAAFHVVQWGGAHVWKVGDEAQSKVFAIASWGDRKHAGITFKVSEIAYEYLKDRPGLRPAPYLASRGMSWIQHFDEPGLSEAEIRDYLSESHRLVAMGFPKRLKRKLGLEA